MGLLERISESLYNQEERKAELGQKISKLMLEWGGFEKHLQSSKKRLTECFNEMEGKEIRLTSVQESVAERSKELERRLQEVERKEKDLSVARKEFADREDKLKEYEMMAEEKLVGISMREKDLNKIQSWINHETHALELKDKELAEKVLEFHAKEHDLLSIEKELKVKETKLESLKIELVIKESELEVVKKDLLAKESKLDSVKKEVRLKETKLFFSKKELSEKENGLESVKKELSEKGKNLEFVNKELREKGSELEAMKEKRKAEAHNLDTLRKQLELKEESLSSMMKEVEHKQKFLDTMQKKLDLEEDHLRSSNDKLHLRERELEQCMKNVTSGVERVKDRLEEIESREKHLEDRFKELEEKEKELNAVPNGHIWMETSEVIAGGSAVIRNVLIVDGKDFQIFLNENEKKLDLMCDGVFKALQMSTDPSQLVLHAMEGFYPPHLTNGETEFTGSVVRRSCLLLLEQLLRLSPKIRSSVREGATNLAREWKVKIKATEGNLEEILGFLYLLASFNLVSAFDEDELIILLEIVAKHDRFAELCRSLGLEQKIHSFIRKLQAKRQYFEAIRYANAFELVDHFPPVAILKDYLEWVEHNYVDVCEKETCSVKEKIVAIEQRVASIRAVIRCILDYKLQSQYPVEQLEECIESLTRQKEDQAVLPFISKGIKSEQADTKQMGYTSPSEVLNSATCTSAHANAMATILMSMGGKKLQNLLNEHLKEHKLLRSKVFSALQISLDSGMLVLEALEGFYPSDDQQEEGIIDRNIIRQSCILLLEQLMELSPEIKADAKREASKLAVAWKAKMMAEVENHLAILGFLLLVGSYRLASSFDKDELESFYHKVSQHVNTSSKICHALGISVNTTRSAETPFKETERHKAQSSTDMRCKGHGIMCSNVSSLHGTSDPAMLVLDALRSCHPANLKRCDNVPSVMRSFSDLLDQLREVSPEIEPRVRVRAIVLGDGWYSTLIKSQPNPTEVSAFLKLLATYKITASFNSDKLLVLLEKVYPPIMVANLLKSIGLTDKIQGFIQNLIDKKQWLVAFTCIYEFDLVNMFSPVLLLKNHVNESKEMAKQILHGGSNSHHAQMLAINWEIFALRDIVRHIADRGLQSEYPPCHIQEEIAKLELKMSKLSQSSGARRSHEELTNKRSAATNVIQGKQNLKRCRSLSTSR